MIMALAGEVKTNFALLATTTDDLCSDSEKKTPSGVYTKEGGGVRRS